MSVSGSSMHVRNKHTDKYEEFKSKFAELKKTAVIKESTTKTPVKPGDEPPRIEDKPEVKPEVKPEDKHPSRGDDKPKEGKSFLGEFDKWLESPEF